jgi:hypothetical protein
MPEVIAVRIPATALLIIVLRVDADTVPHPVLVAGKVLYRVPGHTVPADRQRLLDLVARDTTGTGQAQTVGRMSVPSYPWQPGHIPLWPEQAEANTPKVDSGELRVVGGLTLPQRIADRPWLSSRARQAAVDALNSSPLRNGPTWHLRPWEIVEARATTLNLQADGAPVGPALVESAAHLNLANRSLSLLVAMRWTRHDERLSLPLEVLYWALLGSLTTVASTYRHVARALDAADPSDIRPFEAWLRSSTKRALDVVDIGPFMRDNRDKPESAFFPSARPVTSELRDLDQLARNWLTYWLLDIGTRNFEIWLAELEVPDWLRPPVLALPP